MTDQKFGLETGTTPLGRFRSPWIFHSALLQLIAHRVNVLILLSLQELPRNILLYPGVGANYIEVNDTPYALFYPFWTGTGSVLRQKISDLVGTVVGTTK